MKLPFPALIAFGMLSLICRDLVAGPLDTVALEYIKDADTKSCPSEQTLQRNIAARLGRNAFDKNANRTLSVQLSKRPTGYVAQINIRKKTGEDVGARTLSTTEDDCEELAMAMELAISIAIDPMYLMREPPLPAMELAPKPEPAPAPKQGYKSGTALPSTVPPENRQEKLQEDTVRHLSFGLVTASSGTQSFGITGSFREMMQTRPFSWAVQARVDLPQTHVFSFGKVSTGHASIAGIVCRHLQAFRFCGSVNVGILYSRDEVFDEEFTNYTPYLSGGPRAAYELVLSDSWSVEVGVDILLRVNQVDWEGDSLEFSLGLRSRWRLPN